MKGFILQNLTANMSDADLGKKLVEEEHLLRFLDAYEAATGIALSMQARSESPDFVCVYPSGEPIGVELARCPHDYAMSCHDRIWTNCVLPSFDILWSVASMVAIKEQKRLSHRWPETILVIELLNYSFASLGWISDTSRTEDFSGTGFHEIWIADYSTVEPFGEVRLIGLYPSNIFGLHHQPIFDEKPYG